MVMILTNHKARNIVGLLAVYGEVLLPGGEAVLTLAHLADVAVVAQLADVAVAAQLADVAVDGEAVKHLAEAVVL